MVGKEEIDGRFEGEDMRKIEEEFRRKVQEIRDREQREREEIEDKIRK